jgi:hypothetical protein
VPAAAPVDPPAPDAPLDTAAPAEPAETTPAPAPPAETRPAPAPPAAAPAPPATSDIEAALAADSAAAPEPVVKTDVAQTSGTMNPDIAVVLDVAGAWFSDDEPLQTGAHDPEHTGFNLQQLELSLGAVVDPYLRFDANIVFGLFGVEVEEAYGTTLDMPWRLQARFGQLLHRFGRINASHPHAWAFVDQPFAIGRVFGAEGGRGLGVELSWLTPLPWFVEIVGSVHEAAGEATARSFYGADDLGVDGVGDLLYVTALKQFWSLSDDWSLLWGLSSAFGPNSTGRANRTDVYGTDLYLKFRPISYASHTVVTWQSEILYRRRQIPEDLLQDVTLYSQLFWRFAQRWGSAARYEYGSPAVGLDGDRGLDTLDPDWTESRHRLTANVTHYPTEFSRFRLQVSRDMPGYRDPIWAVFLAAELVVGAHGAHTF